MCWGSKLLFVEKNTPNCIFLYVFDTNKMHFAIEMADLINYSVFMVSWLVMIWFLVQAIGSHAKWLWCMNMNESMSQYWVIDLTWLDLAHDENVGALHLGLFSFASQAGKMVEILWPGRWLYLAIMKEQTLLIRLENLILGKNEIVVCKKRHTADVNITSSKSYSR